MEKMFAVYDVKAAAFGRPFAQAARGLAMRGFVEAAAKPGNQFKMYPADYSLYELGEYDASTGKLIPHPQPEQIMSASQAVNEATTLTNQMAAEQEAQERAKAQAEAQARIAAAQAKRERKRNKQKGGK